MPRFGLCCTFREQPIRFRTTTATAAGRLDARARQRKLVELATHNAEALAAAIAYCADHGIGSFRVNSQILPLRTHPELGYDASLLGEQVVRRFRRGGALARERGVRLTFHPDQFVVLSSPREEVAESSIAEIEYQAEVAEWIGADVINVHGGGAYGDPQSALQRLAQRIDRLSPRARARLTLENDDRVYAPRDLLPLCESAGIPLVYDVHHHRLHGDGLSVAQATAAAIATWDREPLFHVSSPREGWDGPRPERHHDFIALADFPRGWRALDVTVEVEAKAKELAVLQLMHALQPRRGARPRAHGAPPAARTPPADPPRRPRAQLSRGRGSC